MPLDLNQLDRSDLGVPHESLRRYLLTHGWQAASIGSTPEADNKPPLKAFWAGRRLPETQGFEVFTLHEVGLHDIELVVPRARYRAEFERRLEGIFETLSQIEGRDARAIIADIRTIGFDVIRSRIPDELVYEETIQLVSATSYLTGVKSLLAAAATTEFTPDPYFLRVRKEGTSYADKCRFGHTFKGSFGFTIESPVAPNIAPMLAGIEVPPLTMPFERRVVQRIASGVIAILHAAESRDLSPLVDTNNLSFSANMFEQFADIVEETSYGGLGFAFSFSPEWTPPPALQLRREFMIGPPHVEVARTAAKTLRTQPVPRPEQVLGRVVRLQNQADPTELFAETSEGEVVILWASEELGDIQVRLRLRPNDYLMAVEAHRHGRPVRVSGSLLQEGRRWILYSPTNFTIA